MLHVVIPAAGNGQRFKDAGYTDPKPMIDVLGKPMIDRVMESITAGYEGEYAAQIIVRKEHKVKHPAVVELDSPTQGAVDTLLSAKASTMQAPGDSLLVANCDQYLSDFNLQDAINEADGYDGFILTFKSGNPHHSYVVTDENGVITEIKEKQVISNQAVFGVYYFSEVDPFMQSCLDVVESGEKFNNEFYVSTALANMIERGFKLKAIKVSSEQKHILGTPEELEQFLSRVEAGKSSL